MKAYDTLARYFEGDANNPTAETTIIALLRYRSAFFAPDPRWRALVSKLVEEYRGRQFFTAWNLLADAGDVRADVILATLPKVPSFGAGSAFAQALFRLPPSALSAIEAEMKKREGVDRATLENVVRYLKAGGEGAR
jgi:hypothetical protein